jgi:hypothetical protein
VALDVVHPFWIWITSWRTCPFEWHCLGRSSSLSIKPYPWKSSGYKRQRNWNFKQQPAWAHDQPKRVRPFYSKKWVVNRGLKKCSNFVDAVHPRSATTQPNQSGHVNKHVVQPTKPTSRKLVCRTTSTRKSFLRLSEETKSYSAEFRQLRTTRERWPRCKHQHAPLHS